MKSRIYKKQNKKGFILAISILIVSILVTIGITGSLMAYRELSITSVAGESDYAFYAADSALECVLYRDLHDSKRVFWLSGENRMKCGSQAVQLTQSIPGNNPSYLLTQFNIDYQRADNINIKDCAEVYVYKQFNGSPNSPTSEPIMTLIYSIGKTHCEIPGFYGVQRLLETQYQHEYSF